jgi:hypothetical protein
MTFLLHQLPLHSATRDGDAPALTLKGVTLSYAGLATAIDQCATGLLTLGVGRSERVAFYLDKRGNCRHRVRRREAPFSFRSIHVEGGQVGHILRDCNVRVLVTSSDRCMRSRK